MPLPSDPPFVDPAAGPPGSVPPDRSRHDAGLTGSGVSARSAEASRTDWGMVRRAADPADSRHDESLESVAQRYWPIIYAFIRQSGRNDDESRDITQSFLADVLLGRGLLAMASPARGRFRALLLHAVSNFLRDDHRRRTAGRRPPPSRRVPLAGASLVVTDLATTPERAFASAWVAMLVRDAADRLRHECLSKDREAEWTCFEHRVLRPSLHGAAPMGTAALRRLTGLASPSRVMHATASARRRFISHLLEVVGTTTDDPMRVREEIRELLAVLEGGC